MILVNNELDAQFSRMFISILYMFPCAHHQENYCINATPGLCHSVQMTVWYAGAYAPHPMLPAGDQVLILVTSRQHRQCFIPQAVNTV